jgi:hypothetical protein
MHRRTLVFLVIGALSATAVGMVALCSGGAYLAFRSISQTSTEASTAIDALFAAFSAHDQSAYERLTDTSFQQATSKPQFDAIGKVINERLGALRSKTTTNCNVRSVNGQSYADVAYKANFEKGAGTITARLRKQSGVWRLVSFNVQSPVLQAALATEKCGACGASHAVGAKFCPNCGKSLMAEASP